MAWQTTPTSIMQAAIDATDTYPPTSTSDRTF
jgi:hypothetical protein